MTRTRYFQPNHLIILMGVAAFACASGGAPGKHAGGANSSGDASHSQPGAVKPAPDTAEDGVETFAPAPEAAGSREFEMSAPAGAGALGEQAADAPAPKTARPSSAAALDEAAPSSPMRSESRAPTVARKTVERPGLATLWGENRESRVTTTSFNRDGNQPFSILRIQYDDSTGIMARTGLRSSSDLGPNYVQTANGFVSVQIVDERGEPLMGYSQEQRSFVMGQRGDRYSIRVKNQSSERFEVVATVDGLDVLDGHPGSFAKRGYLVDANTSLDIDGFRRSSSEVAAFRFGTVKDSYAAQTGSARNVGVIGVAVFREYHPPVNPRLLENQRRDSADPFPNRFASPPPSPYIRY